MALFVGHDLGTHGDKAVVADAEGRVVGRAFEACELTHPGPDRAEQSPGEWWEAVCRANRAALADAGASPAEVAGLGMAGQMLALVAMDGAGVPTRPAISWIDSRAGVEARQLASRMGGDRVIRFLAGAAPSGKDIVPKVRWIEGREPEVWSRTVYLTDATGYLVMRATGIPSLDVTGAAATGLIDTRKRAWSRRLSSWVRFPVERAAPLRECTEVVAGLTARSAAELGLREGTPVVAGMADIAAAAVGSGAVGEGEGHIYLGTSSWATVMMGRAVHLAKQGIVSVAGPEPGLNLMIGENETAGACVDWFLREVLGATRGDGARFAQLEDLMLRSPPGARGLVFAPWMYGERAPVPDPALRGAFVGLSIEHTRADLARAILEGVATNVSWTLDEMARVGASPATLRVIGGGALSDGWTQLMADATGRPIERVEAPQEAGSLGAALLAAVGTGALPSIRGVREVVRVERTFQPRRELRGVYASMQVRLRGLAARLAGA